MQIETGRERKRERDRQLEKKDEGELDSRR